MKFLYKIIVNFSIIFYIIFWWNSFAENNLDRIELIERNILNYKKNLISLSKKYEVYNSIENKNIIEKINYLLKIISESKINDINIEENKNIMNFLTENLKEIINSSKELLKKAKIDYDYKIILHKKNFDDISIKIADKLDYIYNFIYSKNLKNKKSLTKKEEKLYKNLDKIMELSKTFRAFTIKRFETKKEIEKDFKKNIFETKYQINKIKNILKRD